MERDYHVQFEVGKVKCLTLACTSAKIVKLLKLKVRLKKNYYATLIISNPLSLFMNPDIEKHIPTKDM